MSTDHGGAHTMYGLGCASSGGPRIGRGKVGLPPGIEPQVYPKGKRQKVHTKAVVYHRRSIFLSRYIVRLIYFIYVYDNFISILLYGTRITSYAYTFQNCSRLVP